MTKLVIWLNMLILVKLVTMVFFCEITDSHKSDDFGKFVNLICCTL